MAYRTMNYIKIGILFFVLCLPLPSYAWYADWVDQESTEYSTYYGINFEYAWINPVGEWNVLLNNRHHMVDLYAGVRFWDIFCVGKGFFGFELGYEWSEIKPRNVLVQDGNTILGITNDTGFDSDLTGTDRIKNAHFDLSMFFPLLPPGQFCYNPEGFFTIGVGNTIGYVQVRAHPHLSTSPYPSYITEIEGKRRATLRFGLGAQMLFYKRLGVRVLWRYVGMHRVRGRFGIFELDPSRQKIFHDGQAVEGGLYVVF